MNNKDSLPWTEKYRPVVLDEIISHNLILNILVKMIEKKNFPQIILYGPPGTGKTTTISACAKHMYGEDFPNMVLELNGSDDRGINVVRNLIEDFASNTSVLNSRKGKITQKLVILDEADSMTTDAQFALRTVIESTSSITRFCLICNYFSKLSDALISRCIIFRFAPIPFDLHFNHIKKIVSNENINIDESALYDIVKMSNGDMRKSINVLQSLNMIYGKETDKVIGISELYSVICQIEPDELIKINNNILTLSISDSIKYIENIEKKYSLDPYDIINNLVTYIIDNQTFDNLKTAKILKELAQIEQNLSKGSTSLIQLGAVISAIY